MSNKLFEIEFSRTVKVVRYISAANRKQALSTLSAEGFKYKNRPRSGVFAESETLKYGRRVVAVREVVSDGPPIERRR